MVGCHMLLECSGLLHLNIQSTLVELFLRHIEETFHAQNCEILEEYSVEIKPDYSHTSTSIVVFDPSASVPVRSWQGSGNQDQWYAHKPTDDSGDTHHTHRNPVRVHCRVSRNPVRVQCRVSKALAEQECCSVYKAAKLVNSRRRSEYAVSKWTRARRRTHEFSPPPPSLSCSRWP